MTQPIVRKPVGEEEEPTGFLARFALSLTEWTERWVPDAFIFALIGTILVVGAALAVTPATTGRGDRRMGPRLLGADSVHAPDVAHHHHGHVLATSGPMRRLIRMIAAWPQSPRGAVALVTFFALVTSWINWGFSLVFSAVLALEVARRVRGVDYRALAAASFLGIGSIWAQGLSGSAALQMASPGALQPQIRDIVAAGGLVPGGIIPFRNTIFLWQSLVSVVVEIVVVTMVMWFATPPARRARTAADLGIALPDENDRPEITWPGTPGHGSSTRPSSRGWSSRSAARSWCATSWPRRSR